MRVYLSYYWEDSKNEYDSDIERGEVGIFSTYMLALQVGREYCNKRSIAHTHFKCGVREFVLDKPVTI